MSYKFENRIHVERRISKNQFFLQLNQLFNRERTKEKKMYKGIQSNYYLRCN